MVSMLDSGSSGPDLGRCVVFLGNLLLKGVFHGLAHAQAYQLCLFKKTHSHVLLNTSVITYYNKLLLLV